MHSLSTDQSLDVFVVWTCSVPNAISNFLKAMLAISRHSFFKNTQPVAEYHNSPEKKTIFHLLGPLVCIPTQFVDWNVGLAENMWLFDPYFLPPSAWNFLKHATKAFWKDCLSIECTNTLFGYNPVHTCFLNALNGPSRLLCCWLETVNILLFYLLAYCESWHWSATFFVLGDSKLPLG